MKRSAAFFLSAIVLLAASCGGSLPSRSTAEHAEALRSFYVGLAAMQAADDVRAKKEFENLVRIADGEPAAWTNLGILEMRQKDLDAALKSLERARSLAPENGRIHSNLAVLQSQRGDFEAVKRSLEKAIESDPNDPKPSFALAEELEREGSDVAALERYESILRSSPGNSAVAVEIIRLSAKTGNAERARAAFAAIRPSDSFWEDEVREQHESLGGTIASGNLRELTQKIGFYRNVMLRVPEFRAAIDAVKFSKTTVGEPFNKPLRLEAPDFAPAAPDTALKFAESVEADVSVRFAKPVFIDGDSAPVIAFSDGSQLRIGQLKIDFPTRDVAAIDIDYDFKNDFVAAGERGLKFIGSDGSDTTAATKLGSGVTGRAYLKVFTFDIEIDGDLDLILVPESGPVSVLRNNADGTFAELRVFGDIAGVTAFESADLDEDGDMDPVFIANGALKYFSNERGGQFRPREIPVTSGASAMVIADSDGDGRLDLNVLGTDRKAVRVTDRDGREWVLSELFVSSGDGLVAADLDNNGAIDFVSGGTVRLGSADRSFSEIPARIAGTVAGSADLNGDGRPDLIGTDGKGLPTRFINEGTLSYGWQIIRPRSAKAQGDQRVNSFGIGGEMEVRSGLLAQKRPITSPQVHFGLGDQKSTDLLRIIWGNGFIQAEFDLARDQQILVQQRLTGSCPHLFAWNGKEFALVKDAAPLATSLGLKVSDKTVLPVTQTEEWYKIPGEMLAAKDGFYELRITDELWESYYVDHYSLLAVDHPIGTEIYANELYPVPVPLTLHPTTDPQPFAAAIDERGNDVTKMIAGLDEVYLDTFREGRYQGLAEDHFVELVFPENAAADGPLKIVADGWLHPTDTSLNVAISQSGFEKPRTLSLEVRDRTGRWRTLREEIGVPAGKLKTVIFDIPEGVDAARLRTNMEIFWDRIEWARPAADAGFKKQRLELAEADLLYRGYSVIGKKGESAPEIPDYNRIATTIQRWRAIEGYYTRYGSIRELLSEIDDRYAIVASGDEMRLRFPALPPVRDGFRRDFILIGSGWIKEGDYNNLFSRTVLPLPTHSDNDYSKPPKRLEDDPVFIRNRRDWETFHTRYVASDEFRNAMRK